MEINNFKVSSSDPFFNATKWNGSLEFSKNFENMITSMLGSKFKGIYKPENEYAIGDYVWFEDKCYLISGKQELLTTTKPVDKPVIAYKAKNGFYALKNNKITNFSESTENIKSIKKFDSFVYYDSKDCFFATVESAEGSRLYKVDSKGKSEAVNSNFKNEIKRFEVDEFSAYVISIEEKLKRFTIGDVSKNTLFEDIQFSSNYSILDIKIDSDFIFALNSNGDFLTINKNGGVLNSVNIKNHFKNINTVKFAISSEKIVAFNDDDEIKIFILEKNSLNYCYKIKSEIGKVDNITYSNKHFTFNNDSMVGYTLASRYELKPANLRNLISTSSSIEVKGAILALDFGKAQLSYEDLVVVSPKGFKHSPENTKDSVYSDSLNRVQFVKNRGIQLHGNQLYYDFSNLLNKTIICEFDSATKNVEFMEIPIGDKSAKLKTSNSEIEGVYKIAYEVEETEINATVWNSDKIIENFKITMNNKKVSDVKISSDLSVVLSKIIISDKIEKPIIDFLLSCSFLVNDNHLNSFLPIPTNNKNGSRYIKNSNKSIINEECGIKVNFSSDPSTNDAEIGLNTQGAKALFDYIKEVRNDVDNNFSQKDHKHKFSELQEVPIAHTNGTKGIVSLNNSNNDANQTTAASSLAVKVVNDAVTETLRIANTKLPAAPGTTDGFYTRYSQIIEGDLYNVLKGAKTGMFNGSGLTNGMPWGSHSWKYYYANSHANGAGYTGIIGLDFSGTELGYTAVSNGALSPWRRVWSSANFDPNSKSDNHSHPYLSNGGGTLNGNLRVNGGYLDLAKSNGHSYIRFDAQANDPGYILHHENNNSSIMRFCVSDDRSRQDYFSWGSSQGGFSQCAYMYTDGYFHTDGNIHSSGDITAFSDARLKKNIIPIPTPTKLTEQLNGVIFDRIDNDMRQTGLIAQDVLKVLPEAVSTDDKGYYSVNYGSLVGLLVESIKELNERIKVLENK
ncbi:MAG: tail fiber domain-containing protein [Paraclostridium sp.]